MNTIVYRYGLAAPHEGRMHVYDQMHLAHRFRNALVEIERTRRAEVRALESQLARPVTEAMDAMQAAEAALQDALRCAKNERARNGKRRVEGDGAALIAGLRTVKRAATERCREAQRTLADDPRMIVGTDEIRERDAERRKAAAAVSGVFWGTKALVVDAATKSFAATPLYGGDGAPEDPRFVRRSDRQEAVGIQLQGGLTAAEAMGGEDTRLRIMPPQPGAWSRDLVPGRHDRRRLSREGEVWLRVGSEGRAPVWGAWRLHMDCPLPEGAIIKFAAVHRQRVGPHDRWVLLLTLDVPDEYARHAARHEHRGGAVAIDLGWRALDDGGVRVAAWRDESGRAGTIELDAATLRLLQLPRVIQSERSLAFDRMLLGLAWWVRSGPVPAWLAERTTHVAQWRSPSRIVSLFRDWERHGGDEVIWAQLESFVAHDRHAWAQEEEMRGRAQRRRREHYRVVASRLAQEYDVLVLERFDLSKVARAEARDRGEREDHLTEGSSAARQLAAPSQLREALVNAFRSRGRTKAEMPACDTTRIHAACGVVEDRPVERAIQVTCTGCGVKFDQDQNACEVLLLRYRERPRDVPEAGGARTPKKTNDDVGVQESRWDRARRRRAEREAKVEAARKALTRSAE